MNIEIKILTVNELNDFRAIRLSALLKAPKMFGSSYAVEVKKPFSFFQDCLLSSTIIFGAYHEKEIIGLAALTPEAGIKVAHKAHLSSVFIEPEFQKQGVANKLLHAVIEYAQQHVEQILLTVVDDNHSAIHLYKKLGFQTYGIEPKALKEDMQYSDELLMKLIFTKIAPPTKT